VNAVSISKARQQRVGRLSSTFLLLVICYISYYAKRGKRAAEEKEARGKIYEVETPIPPPSE